MTRPASCLSWGDLRGAADVWLVDDPIDPSNLTPEHVAVNNRIEETLPGRLNSPSDARRTIIMSRLDPEDPIRLG
jgi:hypothetical protein